MKRGKHQRLLSALSQAQPAYGAIQPGKPPQLPDRLLLRPDEVARALSLGRSTIYELMHTDELPVIHIGRAARIPRRAVEAWIEERTAAEAVDRTPLR
jgi:excisionase family DNA binding protein